MLQLSHSGIVLPILIVITGLISAQMFSASRLSSDNHQFAGIDGLRGLLALMVFIHHTGYWYYYSKGQGWFDDGSVLYSNFGQASVCLFFMVSGFLFGHKLLEARDRPLDWLRLFTSRVLRLSPLYLVLMLAVFSLIAWKSGFTLFDGWAELWKSLAYWLMFTIPGHPDINGNPNTHLMVAGVIWTLPYEWYFYLMLPIAGVLLGSRSKDNITPWLILSAACLLTFSWWGFIHQLLWGFAGGLTAALVVRNPRLRALGKNMDWAVLVALVLAYFCFSNTQYYTRLILLTFALSCIASGSNLFGFLTTRACRSLSEVSYGVYLLHGFILYLTFEWILGREASLRMTEHQYIALMIILTPIIVGLATLSWRWVEAPAIAKTNALTSAIRRLHNPSASTSSKGNHDA